MLQFFTYTFYRYKQSKKVTTEFHLRSEESASIMRILGPADLPPFNREFDLFPPLLDPVEEELSFSFFFVSVSHTATLESQINLIPSPI